MWFAYGFPIAWALLAASAASCFEIGAIKSSKKVIEVGSWLLVGDAALVLIGNVVILGALMNALLAPE